jgi:hypothetical protein
MTFLKDGDSINFQKASCTLDGCVKIYTSRVDSVASETGKLLSGLADSASKLEALNLLSLMPIRGIKSTTQIQHKMTKTAMEKMMVNEEQNENQIVQKLHS